MTNGDLDGKRDLYALEALPSIPSLLQLLDRNPLSATYGCFDRSYWHFRTMDFPSGMSQEYALPLALVWRHEFPGGTDYYQEPRVRDWVLASIGFARRSAHKDASCDDYYPFERALGATVYSLFAMAESYALVDADDRELLEFLVRRARWVSSHGETGVLANHHAIAAAALHAVARISGDDAFAREAGKKAEEVLGYQHEEGWFQEYEGFDPGYQTVTIDFLARYWRASGDDRVLEPLRRAVRLLEQVQHPDGLVGGEYASRNTYHCQPHGLELLASKEPAAARVADRLLVGLAGGLRARNDDDRLLGHHVYPYLWAWLDYAPRTTETPPEPPPSETLLEGCGFLVSRRSDAFLIAGLKKGGPFRMYRERKLVANDSGVALVLEDGRTFVSHLSQECAWERKGHAFVATGRFHEAKRELMTPWRSIVLRNVMLTAGRFARNLIRRKLQKKLILGRQPGPYQFVRRIECAGTGYRVTDTVTRDEGAPPVRGIHLGVAQTSIYIAVSQPWERGWLLPWTDLSDQAKELNDRGEISHTRSL